MSLLAVAGCLSIASLSYDTNLKPTSNIDLMSISVKITDLSATSGGSGSIVRSGRSGSLILTNAHVCALLNGQQGFIEGFDHIRHLVDRYRIYPHHDLCLIKVAVNYHINLKIASEAPKVGDEIAIVGHPSLLPTVVTRGHISDRIVFPIFDGSQILIREGQVATATIMPGSSGSPVLNNDGELVGVVFAGQGSLGYALIVPLEYIQDFMTKRH